MKNARNVTAKIDGDKLILTIDLSAKGEPSSTGKSTLLATTKGFQQVDGLEGVGVSLNVNRK